MANNQLLLVVKEQLKVFPFVARIVFNFNPNAQKYCVLSMKATSEAINVTTE